MYNPPAPLFEQEDVKDRISILQINLNKSEKAHLDIINERVSHNYDIILIQEPYTTIFNAIRTPTNFRPVFPAHRSQEDDQIRSVIWVNKRLDTKNWEPINIPDTKDITAIRLGGQYGKISIFNIYNDCTHSRNENALRRFLHEHSNILLATESDHMMWMGDFNRHHPLWDRDEDDHLFTQQATRQAEGLIDLLATYGLSMALPKGIPTLQHMVTKRYSRPDNVFNTPGLTDFITRCEVDSTLRPTSTDHFPIVTNISLTQERAMVLPSYNFREVDWDEFQQELLVNLEPAPNPLAITTQEQLTNTVDTLTQAIQKTIHSTVPKTNPRPDAKRWWNGDLKKKRKELNRLRADSFKFRAIADHQSHELLRVKSAIYGDAILEAKRQHWTNYLEDMTAADIWTANKFIREPAGDGGCPRIPTLKIRNDGGAISSVNNNKEKAEAFARTFFPPPPPTMPDVIEHFEYPEPLPDPPQITKEQIQRHISKLSPHKAHGPDGIPNVLLQRCADILIDRIFLIYKAILELDIFYDPWREFTTVVLRKPNKPNYEVTKAYRPIALISTLAKVLTSIVAENLSRITEQHQLLPKTHFGGRPGRSTADAVHYLIHKISKAWRVNKVVSVLFLDVEGAFPNAVTARLIHNLKKRRVPTMIIKFVSQLLTNRRTRLKFDDYISEVIDIANGIGQGDPLSMLLYIYYNADILEITDNPHKEDAIGYVDDIAILSIGEDFEETTQSLKNIMTKEEGGLYWSTAHNSKFEVSKSVILHLAKKTAPDPDSAHGRIPLVKPALVIERQTIQEVQSFKYLGIQIDSRLRWKEQAQRATANATKWLLQFRRLTKISTGVRPKLMRQLYLAVALPKITYGVDIWYTPPTKPPGCTRNTGSAGALRNLQKAQRIATLAITGTLRTTPNDYVDIHANTYPMDLALLKACFSAMVRYLTLPDTHPLHQIIVNAKCQVPAKHLSPIDKLIKQFSLKRIQTETILPIASLPSRPNTFRLQMDNTREDSINSEATDNADFKVFSDGSGHDNGIGAAAILYEKNRHRPLRSLKAHLGTPDKYNTFEAEAVGVVLALWLIRTTPETLGKTVSLFTDNQSIVMALSSAKAASGQYLIDSIKNAANTAGARLTIKWISGHSKVKGNEDVDKLAKDAADGRSSRREDLPHLLRTSLPRSASALKQEYNAKIKTRWEKLWDTSPRKPRIAQFGGSFPFSSFLKDIHSLTRKQTSIILQIRCGHFPLNRYLHRINKSDTDKCQECAAQQDANPPIETVNHFIFVCPAHEMARDELANKIGAAHFQLSDLMINADRMKALVKFVNRTGRLSY